MAPRRKVRRSRPRKTFTISANGNIKGAVNTLQSNIMSNKTKILGTLGAAAIGKFAAKSFSVGRLAKLGPIAVKL